LRHGDDSDAVSAFCVLYRLQPDLFTVLSVASLFIFRKRPGWPKLRPVSFCFPAIPLAYILVGACMIGYGVIWQPVASVSALATIGAGAAVYHLWLRPRAG
jgi:APA family basic amino acid/polyamine antiporter